MSGAEAASHVRWGRSIRRTPWCPAGKFTSRPMRRRWPGLNMTAADRSNIQPSTARGRWRLLAAAQPALWRRRRARAMG